MIVRRGTNYVSYESDGLIKKAWLYDLKPIEEEFTESIISEAVPYIVVDKNKKVLYRGSKDNAFKYQEKEYSTNPNLKIYVDRKAIVGDTVKFKFGQYPVHNPRLKGTGYDFRDQKPKSYNLSSSADSEIKEDTDTLRFRDLLPKKVKHALYRMSHADKYKGALNMYHRLKKDKDVKARGLSDKKIKQIAADSFKLDYKEFDKILDRKTRYENVLETFEKEMGSTDEFFELNNVGVKTIEDSYEIGADFAKHTMEMTPYQPILSFKLANKVIERNDIDLFADEDEIIDKYKKRYGDRWEDELQKAVLRMKKEL